MIDSKQVGCINLQLLLIDIKLIIVEPMIKTVIIFNFESYYQSFKLILEQAVVQSKLARYLMFLQNLQPTSQHIKFTSNLQMPDNDKQIIPSNYCISFSSSSLSSKTSLRDFPASSFYSLTILPVLIAFSLMDF